jgi:SOS-response transcriptional repressor LexA
VPIRSPCPATCEGGHFTFRLNSGALSRARIQVGSLLLACPSKAVCDGDLVIAETPQGKLVRFFKCRGVRFYLDAQDPDIPPLILPTNAVSILGVVCDVLT